MSDAEAYLAKFEELRSKKRWTTDTTVLRFAALTMATLDTPASAAVLEQAADLLKEKAGWFGSLRSVLRYCVAATILRAGLHPAKVADQIEALRAQFRERRMTRGGIREVIAALILIVRAGGKGVAPATLDRMQELMARWRKDHWWLTGVDDYPLAALHASGTEPIDTLSTRIEEIYEGLRAARFTRGNALQMASHLLGLSKESASAVVARAVDLAAALKRRGIKVRTSQYDELALLTLTGGAPESVAQQMEALVARLRAARPKPSTDLAVSLAAGLITGEAARRDKRLADVRDLAALVSVQAILDQQAAAVAAAT